MDGTPLDACAPQGHCIAPRAMPIHGPDKERPVTHDLVQDFPRRPLQINKRLIRQSASLDPLSFRMGRCVLGQPRLDFLEREHAVEIQQRQAASIRWT